MDEFDNQKPDQNDRRDLARAGDVNLGLTGLPTWAERGRMWAHKQLANAQAEAIEAKKRLNEAATGFLRSQEGLQEEIERNRHWKANIDKVRARIVDEFDAEDHAREIRRLEREVELAEAKVKAAEAAAREEEAREQAAAEKERREAKRTNQQQSAPNRTAEDAFRDDAEQLLRHGVTGKFMPIADEFRQKLIAERGGEQNLTEEDLERIEAIFELARRKQESKS